MVPGNFAIASGLKLTGAVALETPPVQFQQVVAIRRADQGKPWAKDLAAAFKSPFFTSVLDKDFPGYVRPGESPAAR